MVASMVVAVILLWRIPRRDDPSRKRGTDVTVDVVVVVVVVVVIVVVVIVVVVIVVVTDAVIVNVVAVFSVKMRMFSVLAFTW